jgi:hypothetical protein
VLAEFQQALADLTASPDLCVRARHDPSFLRVDYELTEGEFDRLIRIVRSPGMQCACIVYRANRLAPLAMNARATCEALGPQLRDIVENFWAAYPESDVHFFIETARFCEFVLAMVDAGRDLDNEAVAAVRRDQAVMQEALHLSRTESDIIVTTDIGGPIRSMGGKYHGEGT